METAGTYCSTTGRLNSRRVAGLIVQADALAADFRSGARAIRIGRGQ